MLMIYVPYKDLYIEDASGNNASVRIHCNFAYICVYLFKKKRPINIYIYIHIYIMCVCATSK